MADLVQFGSTYLPASLRGNTSSARRFIGTLDPSKVPGVTLTTVDRWLTASNGTTPPPPPPTPPPAPTLATLGAAEPQSGLTAKLAELARDEALVGSKPMPILRYYYGPSTTISVPATLPAGRLYAVSWKPSVDGANADVAGILAGNYDAGLTTALRALPAGSYATIWHEPEGNTGTAANFDAILGHFCTLAQSVAPAVNVGPILMEYQIRAQGVSNFAYGKTVNPSVIDFWGFDAYSSAGTSYRTLAQCATQYAIPYFNTLATGKPFLIAEVGIDAGYTGDRAQWVYNGLKWGATTNTTILYFNENANGTWALTDAEWTKLGQLITAGN